MARKPTDEVQLKLRFEERLRRRLERAAETNNRSMNAEIIHRLEESFQRVDQERLIESIAQKTATATADRFQMISLTGRRLDEPQVDAGLASNQKDKAP